MRWHASAQGLSNRRCRAETREAYQGRKLKPENRCLTIWEVPVEVPVDGLVVVLQCKLYSKPVGNAAVQEAGMAFHKASHAAVVSNAAFTRQARELASASGVVLLHHEQLTDLDQLVGRRQTQALANK